MGLCASKPVVHYDLVYTKDVVKVTAAAADNADAPQGSTCPEQLPSAFKRLSLPLVSHNVEETAENCIKDVCQPSTPPSSSEMIVEVCAVCCCSSITMQ